MGSSSRASARSYPDPRWAGRLVCADLLPSRGFPFQCALLLRKLTHAEDDRPVPLENVLRLSKQRIPLAASRSCVDGWVLLICFVFVIPRTRRKRILGHCTILQRTPCALHLLLSLSRATGCTTGTGVDAEGQSTRGAEETRGPFPWKILSLEAKGAILFSPSRTVVYRRLYAAFVFFPKGVALLWP